MTTASIRFPGVPASHKLGSGAAIALAAWLAGCTGFADGANDDAADPGGGHSGAGGSGGSMACTDACTAGATQGDGNGQVSCTMDAAGCLTWSAPMACSASETCTLGFCGTHGAWAGVAAMPTARDWFPAVGTADHVYIFGGLTSVGVSPTASVDA